MANTAADLEAAKAAVVAHDPKWGSSQLKADLASHADLDVVHWWTTHKAQPYKSIRVWAPVPVVATAIATPATSRIWDVLKVRPDSKWTVVFESNSSE